MRRLATGSCVNVSYPTPRLRPSGHPLPGALGDDEEHRVDRGGAGRHLPAAGAHGEGAGGDGPEVRDEQEEMVQR